MIVLQPVPWTLAFSCASCAFHLRTRGVPCLTHTRAEDRPARAVRSGSVR